MPASATARGADPALQPSDNASSRAAAAGAATCTANGNGAALGEALRGLRGAYGDAWSFEMVKHSANGGTIEVVGQLRANGATVRETAVSAAAPGRSLGEMLERTANDSLRKCAETLMRNGARLTEHSVAQPILAEGSGRPWNKEGQFSSRR